MDKTRPALYILDMVCSVHYTVILEIVLTHLKKFKAKFGYLISNHPKWLEIAIASGLINAQKFTKFIMEKVLLF